MSADPRPDEGDCEACGEPMAESDVHQNGVVRVHRACAASLGAAEVAALASEVPTGPRDPTASPHWEWSPGLVLDDGRIVVALLVTGWLITVAPPGPALLASVGRCAVASQRIDINNPGNHGHLLTLVRKAWGPDVEVVILVGRGLDGKPSTAVVIWTSSVAAMGVGFRRAKRRRLGQFIDASLGLALAAALLAAPGKPSHIAGIDRTPADPNVTNMQNPTNYKGYNIRYVTNDVEPDTFTACIDPLEGGNAWTTSQRIFRTAEEWHEDIRGKIDADIERRHPSAKAIPQMPVSLEGSEP